jgi:hypothetical protein
MIIEGSSARSRGDPPIGLYDSSEVSSQDQSGLATSFQLGLTRECLFEILARSEPRSLDPNFSRVKISCETRFLRVSQTEIS